MVLLSPGYIKNFFPKKICPKKVISIHNFIKIPEATITEKKKEVLYIGRLNNAHKRIDLLLKIWSSIESEVPEWRLIICGDGPDRDNLVSFSKQLKLKNVHFEGHVTNTTDYFKSASIFCMTSAAEGMPMVILESSIYGCIPMAFNSYEAAPDLIKDMKNGRLIESFDIQSYAQALKELIDNPTLRNRLRENAIKHVEQFSSDKIINQWESLFKSLTQ